MDASYEIFSDQPEGPMWIESVKGLEHTKERLLSLFQTKPGGYFAYDVREARVVTKVSCEAMRDSSVSELRIPSQKQLLKSSNILNYTQCRAARDAS
jgi:hypothetical protein